jgi:hypothetical protein
MASIRRVRRVVRKIDPWTVLKVSSVLWSVVVIGLALGVVIFWSFVDAAGYPSSLEGFLANIGLWEAGDSPVVPDNEVLFRGSAFLSLGLVVFMTGMSTLSAVMYNLISDMVGGLEVVVLEEVPNAPSPNALVRPVRQVQSWQTNPPESKSAPTIEANDAPEAQPPKA